ncbi:MAG TPA: ribosome biogenesis GTPase Der [Acidobacteriaceae bacterium]|nr:ribosome biogenesis GTPase Der [Acidobacteriaceae bacterium]
MAQRDDRKRLGKKHRDASTRPKKGRAPRVTPTTGAVDPRKRKTLATKRAELEKKKRTPTRSPEKESRKTISRDAETPGRTASRSAPAVKRPSDGIAGRQTPNSANIGRPESDADTAAELRAWRAAELLAAQLDLAVDSAAARNLPLIAICGRPNVGKSTLFNRLTGSRRSIVGDEPGITRDRIYGELEWMGADARIVDTGGIVPDDIALIPAEIFRQAQTALSEANAIIMVIDGRTELASPDLELARLLLRGGKPVFLAVNKMDTEAMQPQAENFRRLGFSNVLAISAEHNVGIGDLLDEVFAALPTPDALIEHPATMLTSSDEMEEDETGPDFSPSPDSVLAHLDPETKRGLAYVADAGDEWGPDNPERPRRLRSHGTFLEHETKIAIIGRPNVGKSTLLNALTGTNRAIVSSIAGTTRDAVDEVVTRANHDFRFVDTAGIRRKGKTHLMAEKLSVIMARKHLEAADVSLLVLDATEGVAALDANIGGYAHESGRSVIIVVNKWDLVLHPTTNNPTTNSNPNTNRSRKSTESSPEDFLSSRTQADQSTQQARGSASVSGTTQPADPKIYEQQVRDKLKYLDYAPLVFISAASGKGIEALFKKVELVSRERRKRVTTGQMNRFLAKVDFQKASVPMKRRVRIYYMTQAAVAPPTFVLFTDRDVKLHFAFERFLANQIRAAFGFIGAPIWFKTRPRNKKQLEE